MLAFKPQIARLRGNFIALLEVAVQSVFRCVITTVLEFDLFGCLFQEPLGLVNSPLHTGFLLSQLSYGLDVGTGALILVSEHLEVLLKLGGTPAATSGHLGGFLFLLLGLVLALLLAILIFTVLCCFYFVVLLHPLKEALEVLLHDSLHVLIIEVEVVVHGRYIFHELLFRFCQIGLESVALSRSQVRLLVAVEVGDGYLSRPLDVDHLLNKITEMRLVVLEHALLYFLRQAFHLHLITYLCKEVVIVFAFLVKYVENLVYDRFLYIK